MTLSAVHQGIDLNLAQRNPNLRKHERVIELYLIKLPLLSTACIFNFD